MTTDNLFDTYFSFVEDTEPPLIFHRWSLMAAVGAYLGRQFRLEFGDFYIYPNMYVMLIGDPGTRKSTAIKLAKRVLATAEYDKFAAERTSKEKFLLDLEGLVEDTDTGTRPRADAVMKDLFGSVGAMEPKEVFVCADEFTDFVGQGNLEFLSMLGSLWDWDDPNKPFSQRLKNSKSVSIYQPTISILSGNTHAGFAAAFPPEAIGQGFISRLVLIHSERTTKRIAFPTRPSDILRDRLTELLLEIRKTVHGTATLTRQAREALETIYRSFDALDDIRFKHYSTRRFTHLLKLCLICTATRMSTEITISDVMLANTLLSFAEHRMPRALGEFGKARNADIAARLMDIISAHNGPVEPVKLWKQCHADLDKMDDMQKILVSLANADKIQWVAAHETHGVAGYIPRTRKLKRDAVYVDFSLLKGYEI